MNCTYGFIGPNGAGKTTAIKILLGLLMADSGQGSILGYDIFDESIQIRRKVGYLPQKPIYYEDMTAREILAFTGKFYFEGSDQALSEKIDGLLEMIDLGDKANRPIHGFSGGEIQRVGIAQALVNDPELLILDEPAASLDPLGRHAVLDLIDKLSGTITVFYSTHILSDVQRVSDIVGVIDKGQLIMENSIDNLLNVDSDVFEVTLSGVDRKTQNKLESQIWVKQIEVKEGRESNIWRIHVSDAAIADKHILRIIMENPDTNVISYKRFQSNLEDVFIDLVRKEKSGK